MSNTKGPRLPRILYDQTQFTPVFFLDERALWLSDECYREMKRLSGYTPKAWYLYTQATPESFFFGSYDESALEEEARVGFENFNDQKFVAEFEGALLKSLSVARELYQKFDKEFKGREVSTIRENPKDVLDFFEQIRMANIFNLSYYMLTQPERFFTFEKMLESAVSDPNLKLLMENGSRLTYTSEVRKVIVEAAQINSDIKDNQSLKNVIEKYGFLGWQLLGGDLVTVNFAEGEVANLASDRDALAKEAKHFEELEAKMNARSVIFEKNKNKPQYWAAHIIGQSAVLRFDLQTCILAILKYFDKLLIGVREIYKLEKLDLESYKYDEIVELISHGVVLGQVTIKERQFGYARVLDYPDTFAYEGAKAREVMASQLEARLDEINKTKELRGTVASRVGVSDQTIEGKAFVITTAFDAEKHLHGFGAGDILVATQTHPNLVPLMQQALAIVTDEGGITCHAAIVSRELGKPCIIGTKLATKIFKTGDRIVLDFKNGTLKKAQ